MDYILEFLDDTVFNHIYPESIPVDNVWRQLLSLFAFTTIGGIFAYLVPATILYFTIFDHDLKKHPKYIPNQVSLEIKYALWSVPFMTFPTALMFLGEVRGYSQLYDNIDDHSLGGWFLAITVVTFLMFTDFGIYWIHRALHHPLLYGFHKPHHKWLVCTPFASHAFHPFDGFMQSFPYHLYVFLFPMHKWLYLGLFTFVNTWSTMIHDSVYVVPKFLRPFINGSAHHTDHHLYFNYNYGQYFTFWDRIGNSYREPSGFTEGESLYDDLARIGVQCSSARNSIPVTEDTHEVKKFQKQNEILLQKHLRGEEIVEESENLRKR